MMIILLNYGIGCRFSEKEIAYAVSVINDMLLEMKVGFKSQINPSCTAIDVEDFTSEISASAIENLKKSVRRMPEVITIMDGHHFPQQQGVA